MVLFAKDYYGFEHAFDIQRDIIECFDPGFNEVAKNIPNEFQGTISIIITYKDKNANNRNIRE